MTHDGSTIRKLEEAVERQENERKTAGSDWFRFTHPEEPEEFEEEPEEL